jgi:hypothetical protein
MTEDRYARRVGSARPSHLMFTSGVGALVDLPNFSVLVRGTDDWTYPTSNPEQVVERRLLAAVQRLPGMRAVARLQKPPWRDESHDDAARTGVPVAPFPDWLRCTACDELAPSTSSTFRFVNDNPNRPHEARFVHADCPRVRGSKTPLAVAARFVLSCVAGHLDDFPFRQFVHRGGTCPEVERPRLRMQDRSANLGANVEIRCMNCKATRNVREALGKTGEQNLPHCRGRHPHLRTFAPDGCPQQPKVLVVGASNQWFSQTLSALAVPKTGESELAAKVAEHWEQIEGFPRNVLAFARGAVPALHEFGAWNDDQLWAAMEAHRAALADDGDGGEEQGYPDLRTEEWEIFTATRHPDPTPDFALYRPGIAPELSPFVDDVVQAERLREARALVGFSRLDAPDPEDPEVVAIAPLSRSTSPEWVPASEVRGEGLFVRLPEPVLGRWEATVAESEALAAHREAYARYRRNRYSDRITGTFDPMAYWPGARFIALHTVSHLLIRTIALECGYSSASLTERIYAGSDGNPRSGILIYTAVPDAEGTLGGLVSLGEPRAFSRIFRRALADARRCSSDPLCAERLPAFPADFLHGAACHVCLFVSETTCERGNRFLDRRFVAPIDPAFPPIYPS